MRVDQLMRAQMNFGNMAQNIQRHRQNKRNQERFNTLQDFFDNEGLDEFDRLMYMGQLDNSLDNIPDVYNSYRRDKMDKEQRDYDRQKSQRDYDFKIRKYNEGRQKTLDDQEAKRKDKRLEGIKFMLENYGDEGNLNYDPEDPDSRFLYENLKHSFGIEKGFKVPGIHQKDKKRFWEFWKE